MREHKERPKVHRRFQMKRNQAARLASIFVAGAAMILYLGLPADYSIQKRANGANPTSSRAVNSLRPQNASSTTTAERHTDERAAANPSMLKDDNSPAAKTGTAIQANLESSKATGTADSAASSAGLDKAWSVQISAVPAKDVADKLVQQLKAKGYDGYVAEANVRGQTYYRVRVGRFPKRGEAQSMRQSLALQEGYEQAFLTAD